MLTLVRWPGPVGVIGKLKVPLQKLKGAMNGVEAVGAAGGR